MKKLNLLRHIKIGAFIRLNFLQKNIKKRNRAKIIPYGNVYMQLYKDARIELNHYLLANTLKPYKSKAEVNIRLGEKARMIVNGAFSVGYGSDFQVFEGGKLVLNGGYCNCNLIIRCHYDIAIGKGVAIAHNVLIIDTDAHSITGQKEKGNYVHIEDNVWIWGPC